MDATHEAIAGLHGQIAGLVPVIKFLMETHPERDRLREWLSKSIDMIEKMSNATTADAMMSDEAQPVTPMLLKQNESTLVILKILTDK